MTPADVRDKLIALGKCTRAITKVQRRVGATLMMTEGYMRSNRRAYCRRHADTILCGLNTMLTEIRELGVHLMAEAQERATPMRGPTTHRKARITEDKMWVTYTT